MDSSIARTLGLAAITAVITVFVARADGGATVGEAGGRLASDSIPHADSAVTVRWVNEANMFALVSAMNAKQIAAANAELSGWRSDTVRAIATGLLHEHTDLQHSTDSIAASLKVVPQASALNDSIVTEFQAQLDSLNGNRGGALDRMYIRQAINGHRLMGSYLDQLDEMTTSPAVHAWIESASARVASQLTRLTGQQQAFVAADSAAADSVASRGVKHKRQNQNQ